jgi:hypothetical protein
MRLTWAFVALVLLASTGSASAATPIAGIAWQFSANKQLFIDLDQNCINLTGIDWPEGGGPFTYSTFPGSESASGTWSDGAGSVAAAKEALRFDAGPASAGGGRTFKLSAVGLQLAGGRAYLTARIAPAKTLGVAQPPRVRVAVIEHPKIQSGPGHSGKTTVANSFVIGFTGKATIAPALAKALARAKCRGQFAPRNGSARGFRAGAPFGRIIAQLQPSAATGLGGTIQGGLAMGDEQGNNVAITAADGATVGGNGSLTWALPADARTTLHCDLGTHCTPSDHLALPGSITMSYNGRSTVLADLMVSYAPPAGGVGSPIPTVTGTLDGSPVTVATSTTQPTPPLTDEFLARVGSALGRQVVGQLGTISAEFTQTGPV